MSNEIRPNYYRVNVRPSEYRRDAADRLVVELECFELIDGLGLDFYTGIAMKHLFRLGRKPSSTRQEDLRKAITYLTHSLELERGAS